MFSRIFLKFMPVNSIYRKSTGNGSKIIKTCLLSKIEIVPVEKRHISIISALSSNKQNPKKEESKLQSDEPDDQVFQSTNKKSTKSEEEDNLNREKQQKKETCDSDNQTDNNDEKAEDQFDEKNEKYEKSTKDDILGSSLIVSNFANAKKKEKETFLECLRMYEKIGGRKGERVSFIFAALKFMEEFGVHKDLSVYKQIIDIFPKEKMIPTNQFQAMFMHYPKEQYCCVNILEQMENYSVIPDPEMETQLLSIFGRHGLPLQKYWKMMYWMPKFKNLNPWPVPDPIPNDPFELAKLALQKMSSVDVKSLVTIFDSKDVEDSIDKTWIVSAMSPTQSELLLKHDKKTAIFVEGPFVVYVATKSVDYFILRADPILDRKFPDFDPDDVTKIKNPYLETTTEALFIPPSVHEQNDATIFALCATGTSTKDSLLSWIRCLQKSNPILGEIPIVFTLKNYTEDDKRFIENGEEAKQVDREDPNKFIKS